MGKLTHSNKLPNNLPQLQNLIKRDPKSYKEEVRQISVKLNYRSSEGTNFMDSDLNLVDLLAQQGKLHLDSVSVNLRNPWRHDDPSGANPRCGGLTFWISVNFFRCQTLHENERN